MRIPLTHHGARELALLTLGCALLAWGLWVVAWPLVLLPAAVWIFGVAFFRDPERTLPPDPSVLVAPADGTVSDVTEIEGAPLLPERVEHEVVFAAHLRAHGVRDDGEAGMGLQSLDEIEDRRDELAGQRVEAHFDGDVHMDALRMRSGS